MKPLTFPLLFLALLLCTACGQSAAKELADDPSENGGKMTDTIFCTIEIDSTTQIVFVKREVQPGYEEGSWDTLYGDPKLLREGKSFDLYKFPDNSCGFTEEYMISPDHTQVVLTFYDAGWASTGDTTWWHDRLSYYWVDLKKESPIAEQIWEYDKFEEFDNFETRYAKKNK